MDPIDLDALQSLLVLHPEPTDRPGPSLDTLLRALGDPVLFRSLVATDCPARGAWRASRSCQAVEDALGKGLFAPVRRADPPPLGYASTFPVLKSNGREARIIVDPEINDRLVDGAPAACMPHVHNVLFLASRYTHAVCLDAKSYFNQFVLSPGVSRYFCVRVRHGRRGGCSIRRYTRMPMGWAWSVAVAQRSLLLLLRACGLADCSSVWVDNIIICGESDQDIADKLAAFQRVADAAHLTFREECRGQRPQYLGLDIDMAAGTYCFTTKWINKVQQLVALGQAPLPLRAVQSAVGCMVWWCHLTGTSMLNIRHSLRQLAYATAHKDEHCVLPQCCQQEWTTFSIELQAQRAYNLNVFPGRPLGTTVTTDSSSYAAAAVYTAEPGDKILQWWWAHSVHINVLELGALAVALGEFPWPADRSEKRLLEWTTGNTVSENVVRKMYSKSKPLQDILIHIQEILDDHNCVVAPQWIATHLNVKADKASRVISPSAVTLNPAPPFAVTRV